MKVSTILDFIDNDQITLPEFQRGHVRNRDQVSSLMQSLYRYYPVGGLLVWTTRTESAATRGDAPPAFGTVKLLLDGQQRITTLYGIIRGQPPRFLAQTQPSCHQGPARSGEREATGVSEHMRVDGEGEAGRLADHREKLPLAA